MPTIKIADWQGRCGSLALCALTALAVSSAVQAASYRVHPLPIASPDHGPRSLLVDPHDPAASPFGWHDTDGLPGPEFTILRGNNVWVFMDQNNDNLPDGPGPDGGPGLVFDYPAAPGVLAPLAYADALATNAFYLGNMMHDILWHHGFREANGNFQENNYGQGGLGGDPVHILIFKGGGTNNANATITADGTSPRILLYVWTQTNPHREGSFDAGLVGWTYMQTAQRRLGGGPACFNNAENPSIGYSDFFATLITNNFATTTPATPRGMATWLLGQPVTGAGIRLIPYSVDMAVNPLTYADSPGAAVPHGIGRIYASVLWDLAWRLVQLDGFSGNMVTGDGGENRALRLMVQALKLQTCNAGLVDARDAFLAANEILYAGANQCDLWEVFARRGLGASASQGLSSTNNDNVAAFDMPLSCQRIFANGFEAVPTQPVFTQHCSTGGPITIPALGQASVYPVPIIVTGPTTPLQRLRFQVFGLSHTWPDDIDILLVGPNGENLVVQSDAGGGIDAVDLSYELDDAAAQPLPDSGPLTAGSFRPSSYPGPDTFPAPAPPAPHGHPAPTGSATLDGVFGGIPANGTWQVYLMDDAAGDSGSVSAVCLEVGRVPQGTAD